MKLPSPFVYYYYRNKSGWMGVVWSEKRGWCWCLQAPDRTTRRMSQYYPSKARVLELMNESAVELSDKPCDLLVHSVYVYPTSPPIEIKPHQSKWKWKCGKERGIEKSKGKALEEAHKVLK